MTGVTIDHMVSLVALVTALTASIIAYSQIMGAAVEHQQNHDVAMKAAELANTLVLSPGYPDGWGQSNSTPSAFGLQDPEVGGYSLSPFSLQKLLSSRAQVYYSETDQWYSNNSLGEGGSLLVPVIYAVNYTTATKLLGVNGSYGFRLTIAPTLNISISEVNLNPLRLKVEVRGPGLALRDATLNYFLYHAVPSDDSCPLIEVLSGTNQTDPTGSASLLFSSLDGSQFAYSILVYARLGGLTGVGYHSRETVTNNRIIPFVEDFENRTVLLAHSWDGSPAALHFNATFLMLTQNFELRQIQFANSSGLVNSGAGKPYARVQIPTQDAGILIVTYRKGENYGIVMMPWGVSALGFPVTFGGDPSNADWVATELRQVTVNEISYQVKVAVWSTKGYQPWGYNP